MAASYLPSTIAYSPFETKDGEHTPESQEIMYYQGHGRSQHHPQQPQQQQQNQHHLGIAFPTSHQPPLVLSDYQMHHEDTPSSMDDQFSPIAAQNENGKRPSLTGAPGSSRKRARKESDFEPDASVDANSPQDNFDPKEGKPKATRGARACTVCRRLKMKCVALPGLPDGPCKRCQGGNHTCVFEESNRGKRSSKKHEQLTKSLRKMERTLDTVLRSISNPTLTSLAGGMVSQSPSPGPDGGESSNHDAAGTPDTSRHNQDFRDVIAASDAIANMPIPHAATYGAAVAPAPGSPRLHSLPDNVLNPLGLLAEASSSLRRGRQQGLGQSPSTAGTAESAGGKNPMALTSLDNPKVGVANLGVYFKPGPMTILPLRQLIIERQVQPEMLSFVATDVVVELFKIYFEHMNPHTGLLHANFHTPALICSRSPFLLTTICAISSKFYTQDEELHPKLTKLVNKLAWSVPERGYKSVEIVQAYLLLSLWGSPVERYEHDRTWMLLGMAIRMATDLNLHRKNTHLKHDSPEGKMREVEVRNRERTWLMCFILDRSFSAQLGKPNIVKEDYIIRDASQWCRHPDSLPQDVGLVAYVELQKMVSRSLDLLYSGTTSPSGLQTTCDYLQIIRPIESQIDSWLNQWSTMILKADSHTPYRVAIAKFYYNYAMLVINSFGLQNAFERSPVDIPFFFGRVHTTATACCLAIRDEIAPAGFLRYAPDSHFVLTSYAVLSLLKLVRAEFLGFIDDESKILSLASDVAETFDKAAVNKYHTPHLYSVFLRALLASKVDQSQPSSPRLAATSKLGNQGPVISANDPSMVMNGSTSYPAGLESPSRANFGNTNDMFGLEMYKSLGENYGDMSNFVNPFDMPTQQTPSADTMQHFSAENPLGTDPNMPMSLDSFLSAGFWDSMLVPGFSNTLEGMSGGFIYGPGGSGYISRWHSPSNSRRQSPKTGMTPLPVG
ncbi:hypothetical protein M408DRAFT_325955 [Serendipita vermifera MAFF 305830]|uniref:Zn(2)-C6 fungal-type domain-containing protein n=1 Tax=Serendipita vermifera MAFF 305830 TaxID=933852 RepID=A0A0C3BM69_SERVB|nr:hypothetical protein M408DRAFT_325955 [Serendipita vermifera MAFF 305830]